MKILIYLIVFFVYVILRPIIDGISYSFASAVTSDPDGIGMIVGILTAISAMLAYICGRLLCKVWYKHKAVKAEKGAAKGTADAELADFLSNTAAQHADSHQLDVPSGFALRFSGKKEASTPASGAKRQFPVLVVLLCLAVIILAALLIAQRGQYEAQMLELSNQISKLEDTVAELEVSHESCGDAIFDLQRELLGKENSVDFLNERIDTLNQKIAFFDDNAVIVPDDSTGKYHTYNCFRWRNAGSFWIYNVEAAKSRGYEPCSCCD